MNKNVEISKDTGGTLSRAFSEDECAFAKELKEAKVTDITSKNTVSKKSIIKAAFIGAVRYAVIIACILVFAGSVIYIAAYGFQYLQKQQENEYLEKYANGQIKTMFASVAKKQTENVITLDIEKSMAGEVIEIPDQTDKTYNEYFEKKRSQIISLQRSYPDVWGWIDIPGTSINYVVMQGKTNNDYLYMSYDGKQNRFGSIFADYRISRDINENKNTILFGHNMNSARTMFAPLLDFVNDENAFQNNVINIITPDGLYTYSLFSVYDTDTSYNYIRTSFGSDDEYVAFLNELASRSVFKKKVTLNADTKLLTLSTCTVRGDGRRWAFHAVLIGVSR